MSRTHTIAFLLLVGAGGLAACKGDKVVEPDPQTKNDLDTCRKNLEAKNGDIDKLKETNAQLVLKAGSGAGSGSAAPFEVEIKPEGAQCQIIVKPPAAGVAGNYTMPPTKEAEAASAEFYKLVIGSRGEMQKCYEQVLKKNTGLQNKDQMLTVRASFANGAIQGSATFSPSLGGAFDTCMTALASKWKLTGQTSGNFQAPVLLKPS